MSAARHSFAGGAFTVAVVTGAGSWSGAAGVDGTRTALTPYTELAVGSITKTFTTAEILHLVDIHAIGLDQPTSRWVTSPLTANGATIRQTLSMTSGIRDGNFLDDFIREVSPTPDRASTPSDALAYLTASPTTIGTPGAYSNAGFLILGELIQRVTGLPYGAAIRRDLLTPRHLDRVAVQTDEAPSPPVGYPMAAGGSPVTDGYLPDRAVASSSGAAGSIAADAPDLATWAYDLYVSHSVVPPADVAAMTTPDGLHGAYGMGTVLFRPTDTGLDEATVGHNGRIYRITEDGNPAVSDALVVVDPTQDVALALLAPSSPDEKTFESTAGPFLRAAGAH